MVPLSQDAAPEAIESLLRTACGEDIPAACEAAQALSLLRDSNLIPRLVHARELMRSDLNAGDRLIDASEGRKEMALTMAIISLLPFDECQTLLEQGDEFEKYMVRRKRSTASLEEYWGATRG